VDSAYLASLAQEVSDEPISIRDFYQNAHIYEHLVKFEYANTTQRLLVTGDRSDAYFGVHIRNILREECGVRAPMIDIELLHSANIHEFDEIIVCYNKGQVQHHIEDWKPADCPRLVYLDDLISKYFWLLEICELLWSRLGPRDVVRGILGQSVEQTSALQLDGWNALRTALLARSEPIGRLVLHGSGAGLLPLILRDVPAKSKIVYESNVLYRKILNASKAYIGFDIAPEEQFLADADGKKSGSGRGECVIFCDTLSRISDPKYLPPYFAGLQSWYATMFLSCETKPHQAAIFRKIGDINAAFGRVDARDMRCYGQTRAIWMPRERGLSDLFRDYAISRIYESNDQFSQGNEFSSGYLVIEATRARTR
jgi:hypothetical protein